MNKSVFLPATRASLLLACCAFFSGCEDDSFKEDFEAQQNNSPSYSVGRESAKKEALNAVKAFFSQSSTREIGSVDALLSDAGSSDTLAYVCNFKGDAGFAIVVADERVKDKVIACTDQGSFDGNSDNPGFTFLLNNIKAYAEQQVAESKNLKSTNALKSGGAGNTVQLPTTQVGPLIRTAWSQGSPYNTFVDDYPGGGKYYTGCTITAIAQLIGYYNQPGISMMPEMTAKRHAWELDDFHKTWVGILFRSIWNEVPKIHQGLATGVAVEDGLAYLSRYGHYTQGRRYYTKSTIMTNVGNQHPVIMSSSSGGGHTWLVDGYRVERFYYTSNPNDVQEGDTYFHINWGWDGDCDGWFAAGCFNVDAAVEFDEPHFNYNRNYTSGLYTYLAWPNNQ